MLQQLPSAIHYTEPGFPWCFPAELTLPGFLLSFEGDFQGWVRGVGSLWCWWQESGLWVWGNFILSSQARTPRNSWNNVLNLRAVEILVSLPLLWRWPRHCIMFGVKFSRTRLRTSWSRYLGESFHLGQFNNLNLSYRAVGFSYHCCHYLYSSSLLMCSVWGPFHQHISLGYHI